MNFELDSIYHIYNRGNNSQPVFLSSDNYIFFLKKIRTHLLPVCDLLAYCLMPNHFHLMLYTHNNYVVKDKHPVNQAFSTMLSSYTQAFNKQQKRTGSLFQQKSKAKNISDKRNRHSDYEKICFHYIHQNPMRARIVKKMEDWEYSSFRDFTGLRNGTLCNQNLAISLLDLPKDKRELLKISYESIDDSMFDF